MLESLARPEKSQSIHLSVNNLLFSHLLDAPKPRATAKHYFVLIWELQKMTMIIDFLRDKSVKHL
jgi:hypothetical protein